MIFLCIFERFSLKIVGVVFQVFIPWDPDAAYGHFWDPGSGSA